MKPINAVIALFLIVGLIPAIAIGQETAKESTNEVVAEKELTPKLPDFSEWPVVEERVLPFIFGDKTEIVDIKITTRFYAGLGSVDIYYNPTVEYLLPWFLFFREGEGDRSLIHVFRNDCELNENDVKCWKFLKTLSKRYNQDVVVFVKYMKETFKLQLPMRH